MSSDKKQLEKKWFVLRAISGKEKKVKEYIEHEIAHMKDGDQVAQVVIPVEKKLQVRNGKKVVVESNLMPGYILIEAALNPDIITIITSIPNVIDFLSDKKTGVPIPLREHEAKKMLGVVDEITETGSSVAVPYMVGETVKVTDGPFNEFTGVIEEVMEEKKKLRVMVKIFGRKTPLDLNYMQVERIS